MNPKPILKPIAISEVSIGEAWHGDDDTKRGRQQPGDTRLRTVRKQWYVHCDGRLRIGSLGLMSERRLDDFAGALEEPLSAAALWCLACGVSVFRERVSTQAVSLRWPGAIGNLLPAIILALVIALLVNNDEVGRNAIACRHFGERLVVSMELEQPRWLGVRRVKSRVLCCLERGGDSWKNEEHYDNKQEHS